MDYPFIRALDSFPSCIQHPFLLQKFGVSTRLFREGDISHLKFLPCHHCPNPPCWRVFWGLPVLQRFRELTRPTARELFVTVLWLFQDSNFSCSHWLLLTLFSPPSSLLTGFLISIAQCTCILSLNYMHLNWSL